MEKPGQPNNNSLEESVNQVQPKQKLDASSGVFVGIMEPPPRLDFKLPLFSSSKGVIFIAACCLIILGGGTATVIEVANTLHKSPAKSLQKSVNSPNLPNASVASDGTSHSSSPNNSVASNPTKSPASSSPTSSRSANISQPASSSSSNSGSGSISSPSSSGSGSSGSGGGGNTSDGCTYGSDLAPCVGSTTNGQNGWGTPSFDDEFSGSTLNTSVWNTHNGWTNQNNVTTYASNVSVSGGDAILTLVSSSSGAEIGTQSYTLPVGGFAEARIEFPGNGAAVYNWPAWWASGPNWPQAGEADIFEGLGSATTNYHYYSGGNRQVGPFTIGGTWTNGFHIYGLYRGSGHNDVYWDGNLVKSYTTSDNGQGETLLLNVGAANTPAYGVSSEVKVDYVRAWN